MNENLNTMEKAVLEVIKQEYLKEYSTYFLTPTACYSVSGLDETKTNNILRGLAIRDYISFDVTDKQISLQHKCLTLKEKALNYFNS